mgnify:CR=1 FL=1
MNQPDPRHQGFLHTDNLVKRFDEVIAVDEVSISIQKGEIFALLGSSGCGKSTLLRMMAGFEKPTSGKVFLDGVDIASFPPYERPINMMFQSYALFPHMTVEQNIAFGLKQDKLPKAEITARVAEMLQRFEARLCPADHGEVETVFPNEDAVVEPYGAIDALVAAYANAETTYLTAADASWFLALCLKYPKPVPFVSTIGTDILHFAKRAENSLKGFLTPGALFEALGFDYLGPLDGHAGPAP